MTGPSTSTNNSTLNTISTASGLASKAASGLAASFTNNPDYAGSQTLQTTAGVVSGVLSEVVSLLPYVSIIYNLLSPQQNQTNTLLGNILTAVNNGIQAIEIQNAGNFILLMQDNLNGFIGDASALFQMIQTVANQTANGQPPPSNSAIDGYIYPVVQDLGKIVGSSYWQVAPSDYQFYWTDPEQLYAQGFDTNLNPTYQMVPPNQGGFVFNYVYALPAYMMVLSEFLTAGRTLDPTFTGDYNSTIQSAGTFLQNTHKQIQAAITTLSPSPWTGQSIATLVNGAAAGGFSSSTGVRVSGSGVVIEYGAVEPYSGANSVGMYTPLTLGSPAPAGSMPTNIDPNSTDNGPYNKFQIRVKKRQKDVYAAVGLPAVWQLINSVNILLGVPPMPRPTYAGWSVLQDLVPLANVPAVNGKISLMAIAKFIKYTAPADTPAQSLFTSIGSLIYV